MGLKDLIASRIRLTKRGRIYWGLCPFHPDKHPSLAVYPDNYYCFACGAHGNEITWLMKYEKLGYGEAKKKAGREVPARSPTKPTDHTNENMAWPDKGVNHQETALLRERLVASRWSDERVVFSLWASAPALDDDQLRLRHPYAQDVVLSRLRKIYPKPLK